MIKNPAFEGTAADDADEQEQWDSFEDDEAWDFLEKLEDDYSCAGLCYPPLWYLTKSISVGPPN